MRETRCSQQNYSHGILSNANERTSSGHMKSNAAVNLFEKLDRNRNLRKFCCYVSIVFDSTNFMTGCSRAVVGVALQKRLERCFLWFLSD